MAGFVLFGGGVWPINFHEKAGVVPTFLTQHLTFCEGCYLFLLENSVNLTTLFRTRHSKDTIRSLEKMKDHLAKEMDNLETKLEIQLAQWQPAQLKNVGSIKGIGKRATAMLIVFTQGFKYTHNRQLISFAGLAPSEYSSGTSIHGKSGINKRGGKNLRDVLYRCSMNAIKTNPAWKALYERLRANGKTGKQGLIAVCNKLLKQVLQW